MFYQIFKKEMSIVVIDDLTSSSCNMFFLGSSSFDVGWEWVGMGEGKEIEGGERME